MKDLRTLMTLLLAGAVASTTVACGGSDDDNGGTPTPDAGTDGSVDPDTGEEDTTEEPDAPGPDPDVPVPDSGPDIGPDTEVIDPPDGAEDTEVTPGLGNIIEVATEAGTFTTLLAALDTAELTAALEGEGPFTVFAPSDDAFADFLAANELTAEDLLGSPDLAQILTYHVVAGASIGSGDVTAGPFTTLADLTAFASTEGGVFINGIEVVTPDVPASNGVIHVIDGVLMPPTIADLATYAGGFDTLLAAATEGGIAGALASNEETFTVFAPTDDAFADLLTELDISAETLLGLDSLTDILLYHAISGAAVLSTDVTAGPISTASGFTAFAGTEGGVTINGANVILADLKATNGVVHVIDSVLMLPTIADLATYAGNFSTLLAAATAAEIEGGSIAALLSSDESPAPYTVFAPTDAAFADALTALGLTAEQLLASDDLADILLYHTIVGASVRAAEVSTSFVPMGIDGINAALNPNEAGDGWRINAANIVLTDLIATNGVIHVIDAVILPPAIATLLSFHPEFSTLVLAASTAALGDGTVAGALNDEDASFTLFAPTNDAFGAALADLGITAEQLLASDDLTNILLYHALGTSVDSSAVADGVQVPTLLEVDGSPLSLTFTVDGGVFLNGVQLDTERLDIRATNGLIHVLNGVLLPPSID